MYRAQLISIENLSARGISCVNPLLLTSFTAINYSPCVGTPLTFTAGNATGATYAWNFGDPASGTANTSTLQAPSHSFSSAGIYTVTLTITIGTESVGVSKQVYPVNCAPINNVNTNWFFSTLSAFSFQTGIPVQSTITTTGYANSFHEACAVQSNDAGQLLFYTNGVRVFNSSQTSVNNSNLLLGNTSSNDGALIVPDPSGPNKYYIFTKAAEGGMDGFRHTKVEMVGSTPVLSNVNTPVTFPAGYMIGNNGAIRGTEGISAIQKCDGWWIITGLRKTETQHFTVVYSLDSTGLHYVSEIQTESGSLYQNGYRISPDGNYVMAGTLASATVMDFDKNTGILSNLRSTNINGLTNACFSPNSKYLYIAYPNFGKLYQYDLTNPSLNAGREEMAIPFANTGQMQMGPDNKLYLLMYNNSKLAVIHYPNNKATIDEPNAYHFTHEGPTAQSPGLLGLPNVIHARLATVYTNTISANALSCLQYRFVANACAANYSWNFGDSASGAGNTSALAAPTHTFSGPGTYTVTVIADGAQIQLQVTVGGTTPVISGSTTACVETGNQTSHSAPLEASSTVQWSIVSGSGSFSGPSSYPDVTVSWTSLPGTIRLTVTDATGCVNSADQIVTSDCQTGECPGDLVFSIPQPINTVTYNVSNSITGENDYTIESGTTVDLLAGKVVLLKPNAWVKAGSVFLAAIVPCPEARSLLNTEDISTQQLVAYPNPTKGVLQLSGKPIAEVTIFDIIGKKVYQSGYDDVNQVTIDMSNFLKGLYLVRVVTDTGEVQSIKIIKE
jgi:PKD repeat protein